MAQNYSYPSSSAVTATIAAVGVDGVAIPLSSILIGAENPSHNLQQLQATVAGALIVSQASPAPLPTGAATAANQVTEIASLASIDTKLTAPLSVTGPLTDAQLRATAVPVSAAALPLPSGAATAALQTSGNASLTSIDSKLTSPLVVTGPLTDTQLRATAVPVSGTIAVSNFPATQPVSGTVAVSNFPATQPISAASLPLPTGASTAANQATEIASLASIDTKLTSPLTVKQQIGSTSTVTSVASSASSVSLLASNASRIGATFYNDSTQICYLKLGATASSTSYTIQMAAGSYYELPFPNKMYTGAIDGIWASANGNMRITELV